MTSIRCLLILGTVLILTCVALGAESDWQLVWEDDFDRVELGQDWIPFRGAKASIESGRLLMLGGGATLITARPFKPDVRFEFEAEAYPENLPCDLSATIGANEAHGYSYLLAFGGQSNRVNQLLGPGIHQVDQDPPFLIEHGKKYRIVAQKEGRRYTYTVNGVKILDAEADNPAAGPGFDRVGLVTWNGMYVDCFKVYERVKRHPDTPEYFTRLPETAIYRDGRNLRIRHGQASPALSKAVEAFNKGDLDDALKLFRQLGGTLGLIGEAYVIGDLRYEEKQAFSRGGKTPDFEELAAKFADAVKAYPKDETLAAYAWASESLPNLIMVRSLAPAIRLVALGSENNPFYHKARLYQARYHYWNGAEGGNAVIKKEASDWMAELKETWPENAILRQYTGEQVPWGEELNADTENHPAWASYLREAYARNIKIMERFFTRQSPDGQLGGGYGDDVELMRTWMQIAAISSAGEKVRAGIECLAEGVWNNETTDGFSRGIGDVEHSAEPSADTFPTMLLIRYGDPLWVERNMRSCKTIKEQFMGIDDKGYPRFISTEFGADGVHTDLAAGGDTGYSARAMKHFIWQAWWGDPEAKDWFVRWADGWRAATMAQIDEKIPGFVPATIWYPSGEIHPPVDKPWWDEKINYYGFPGLGNMVMDTILCAGWLTGDPKFLEPTRTQMDIATHGPLDKYAGSQVPSKEWQMYSLLHSADPQQLSLYKMLTHERVYDEYIRRSGDAAQIYRLDYDLDAFMRSFERAAKSQRHNLEFQTTEVLSTDRAALGHALTTFGAYTGAIMGLRDAATPTFAVTYETADTDFAALVTESTPKRVRVWLYSFADAEKPIGLRLWQLTPGKYVLNQGDILPGEREFQNRYGWIDPSRIEIRHRAQLVGIRVPPQKVWVVDLRLEEPISVPKSAPDLAINARDVVWDGDTVKVTVHNIGNADAKPFSVELQAKIDGAWKAIAEKRMTSLPAPKSLVPSNTPVSLAVLKDGRNNEMRVVLDPKNQQYEIFEENNVAPCRR